MAKIQEIIDDIVDEIQNKKTQRESLLDQLALADVALDKIDELVVAIDKDIPPLLDKINVKIQAHVDAYQARVDAGCKSDLEWTYVGKVDWGDEEADEYEATFVGIVTGKYGVKYYQSPKDRDFGTALIHDFHANVGQGNTVIAVTGNSDDPNFNKIRIGDEITDDLEEPEIFPVGSFPKVVGFGRTDTLSGITTTLSGYIAIGSSELYNTGIGTNQDIPILSGIAYTNYLPDGTQVVGFGVTQISVGIQSYYGAPDNTHKEVFVSKTVTAYILSNAAVGTAHSGSTFQVGLTTNVPSIIVDGTTASQLGYDRDYYVLRNAANPDEDFDFNKFPNDPVKIGVISSSKVGVGHSLILVDDSSKFTGYPTGPFTWYSNKQFTYTAGSLSSHAIRSLTNDKSNPFDETTLTSHPEPKQGGGGIKVPIGTDSWPCLVDADGDSYQQGGAGTRWVSEGLRTFVYSGTPPTETTPPSGSIPSGCAALKTAIDAAEAEMAAAKAEYEPQIRSLVDASHALRENRADKQIKAWGILQSAAWCRSEIQKLEKQLASLRSSDFTPYES